MTKIWVIYAHPIDYPDSPFVVREHRIEKGRSVPEAAHTADTLTRARRLIPPGAQRVPRAEGDEPQIVEWWFGRPENEPGIE
jgi:hypothetical protein